MAETLYFRHLKTGKRYRIISLDPATRKIVLEGEMATFTETYDRERFKQMGYQLEKEITEDAE